jgi:cytoskeletal protein CcmA (bactofilin family)
MFQKKKASIDTDPHRSAAEPASRTETVIGSGVEIKGDIKAPSSVELRGIVDGSFEVEGLFVVRESGRVNGNVTAKDVVVHGTIVGRVIAAQKVELGPSGRIQGDMRAKAVSIAEGAFFEGKVEMLSGVSTESSRREKEKEILYAARTAV